MVGTKNLRRARFVVLGMLVSLSFVGADVSAAHAAGDTLSCTGGIIIAKVGGGLHTVETGDTGGFFKYKTGLCNGTGAFAGVTRGKAAGQFQGVVNSCTLLTQKQSFGIANFNALWKGKPRGRVSEFSIGSSTTTPANFGVAGFDVDNGTGTGDTFQLTADPVAAVFLNQCSSTKGLTKFVLTNVSFTVG
jgi:hypothetical protein